MPSKTTVRRMQRTKSEGKAPSTQAGAFVREEIEHVRQGKHGARSPKQAIAIGLSKARRSGVKAPVPRRGTASASTRKKAAQDLETGVRTRRAPKRSGTPAPMSKRRSRATTTALKREPKTTTSHKALSRQAKSASRTRRPKTKRPRSSGRVHGKS
jgi:hypothetical protein